MPPRAWHQVLPIAFSLAVGGLLGSDPVLATGEIIRMPQDRFEFAPVPEHAFVAGLPETVQLGIWQIDPANPWPAGDQTRLSGWSSRHATRLVDAASGRSLAPRSPGWRR